VLPELDGFAIVDWMRHDPSLSRLPLLVYSAQEVGVDDQQRLRLGPTEFLTKTRVSPEQFEQHVVRLLRRLGQQEVSSAA
jgi:CheY-like chemotaxis protein